METKKSEVVAMYLAEGHDRKKAEVLAAGYMDAIDGIVEGMYFMLKIIGPVGGVYTTKQGHQVKGQLEAL